MPISDGVDQGMWRMRMEEGAIFHDEPNFV